MNLVSRHDAGYKLTFEYQHLSRDLCGSLHLSYVRNSPQTLKTLSACTETGGKVDSRWNVDISKSVKSLTTGKTYSCRWMIIQFIYNSYQE